MSVVYSNRINMILLCRFFYLDGAATAVSAVDGAVFLFRHDNNVGPFWRKVRIKLLRNLFKLSFFFLQIIISSFFNLKNQNFRHYQEFSYYKDKSGMLFRSPCTTQKNFIKIVWLCFVPLIRIKVYLYIHTYI